MGRSKHPLILKFSREAEFWKRLGLRYDPRPLHERSWQEEWGYGVILDEVLDFERRARKQAEHNRLVGRR